MRPPPRAPPRPPPPPPPPPQHLLVSGQTQGTEYIWNGGKHRHYVELLSGGTGERASEADRPPTTSCQTLSVVAGDLKSVSDRRRTQRHYLWRCMCYSCFFLLPPTPPSLPPSLSSVISNVVQGFRFASVRNMKLFDVDSVLRLTRAAPVGRTAEAHSFLLL